MPILEDVIFEKQEGKTYPNLPKKIYQCELLDVERQDNETYDSRQGKTKGFKKYEKVLKWQFTILKGRDEEQTDDKLKELRGRNVWENYCKDHLFIGKNGKNTLYRIVEAFLGRVITKEEEAKGITSAMLNNFIGKQILLSIEPKTSKAGKTFDDIMDYLTAEVQLPALTEEEKEKARVKKDENNTTENNTATDREEEEIDIDTLNL